MSANASSPSATTGTALRSKHGGSAALRLDETPVRPGGWLSGVMEVPERFHGADVRLYVECVHAFHGLSSAEGSGGPNRKFLWYEIALLDGTRPKAAAGRMLIPFAVRIPEDAPPTSLDTRNRRRVDWILRVRVIRPGASYRLLFETEFEFVVEPLDESAPPATVTPSRAMPELTPEDVAKRLDATVEQAGDTLRIRFPFPAGAAATAVVAAALFTASALGLMVPGLTRGLPLDPDALVPVAVVSGLVAAAFLFVLLSTARAVEVRPETVRITRGILGLGFHTSVAARDVEAVLENPYLTPKASPAYYGVGLRLRNGAPYNAASRMRDPASARALASLLSSVLPRR